VLHRRLVFTDTGSTRVNPLIPLGDNGGDAGGTSVIPAAYWSYAVSPQLRLGLGVSVPFGNKTDWDDGFIGRYQGTLSDIKTININPSFAWRINDMVSLGFGTSHLKLDADLRSRAPIIVPGLGYLGDADVKLKGDDTTWTYNLGAMFQLSPLVPFQSQTSSRGECGGCERFRRHAQPGRERLDQAAGHLVDQHGAHAERSLGNDGRFDAHRLELAPCSDRGG